MARKKTSKTRKSSKGERENSKRTSKLRKVTVNPSKSKNKTPAVSECTVERGVSETSDVADAPLDDHSEESAITGKECRPPSEISGMIRAQNVDFSEAASKKAKDNLKSAMKAGKEKSPPYDHEADLADPWTKNRDEIPEDYKLMLQLVGVKEGPEKKRWPKKIGTPTADMKDFLDEIPSYLKHIGVLQLFKRIIMNLYTMNPRPKNPCLEIFYLLDEWFGASDKSKVVETLEREYHSNLLRELRIVQEIGKLQTLCHFLLPEEYSPDGEVLSSPKQPSEEEVCVIYGGESESEQELEKKSEEESGKKGKKKKDKDKKGKSRRTSSLPTISSNTSRNKPKKKKK